MTTLQSVEEMLQGKRRQHRIYSHLSSAHYALLEVIVEGAAGEDVYWMATVISARARLLAVISHCACERRATRWRDALHALYLICCHLVGDQNEWTGLAVGVFCNRRVV